MPNASLVLGLGLGLGCVLAALRLEGIHLPAMVNLPALLVVVGGALGATIVGFHVSDLGDLGRVLRDMVWSRREDRSAMARLLARLGGGARRSGPLHLEAARGQVDDEFLSSGLQLISDGTEAATLERVMESRMEAELERLRVAEAILESVGGYCPTFGILGTVLGLVGVLAHLQQQGLLVPGVATAFTATFYGLAFANMLFLPLAARVHRRAAERQEFLEMLLTGLLSIRNGEPRYTLEDRLQPFLPVVRPERQERPPLPALEPTRGPAA